MTNKKVANIFPIVVGLSIGISVALVVQYVFFTDNSYEQELRRAAAEITKSCPVMVDEETRLDSVVVRGTNTIRYSYTLVKTVKSETDVASMKKNLVPVIQHDVGTNPQMAVNREHKTTMVYEYHDNQGEFLFEIPVTPDMYNHTHQ